MAGKTPHQALSKFVKPLQIAISCITRNRLNYVSRVVEREVYSLFIADDEPVPLQGSDRYSFYLGMHYMIVPAEGELGDFKVKTKSYLYEIKDSDGKDLLSFHWHPERREGIKYPHIHVGHATGIRHARIRDGHIPSGRVSAEAIIRFAIEALHVKTLRSDWDTVLKRSEAAFEKWKTW